MLLVLVMLLYRRIHRTMYKHKKEVLREESNFDRMKRKRMRAKRIETIVLYVSFIGIIALFTAMIATM